MLLTSGLPGSMYFASYEMTSLKLLALESFLEKSKLVS